MEPVLDVPNLPAFEEHSFMLALNRMSRREESLDSVLKVCIQMTDQAYRIVRSLSKVIKTAGPEQKLTVFYLMHKLVLELKDKNMNSYSKRIAQMIMTILPTLKASLPLAKVKKCIKIWTVNKCFDEQVIWNLNKIVSREKEITERVPVFADVAGCVGMICPKCRVQFSPTELKSHFQACKVKEGQNHMDREKKNDESLSDRLIREFEIDVDES